MGFRRAGPKSVVGNFASMVQRRRSGNSGYWRAATSRLFSIALLFKEAGSEWVHDDVLRLSAAFSFYAVLSLVPLVAIVTRVMGALHAGRFARNQIIWLTRNLMGAQAANAIKPIIESNVNDSIGHVGVAISTVILMFSATSVFIELQNAMNSIWDVEFKADPAKERVKHVVLHFIRTRLLSLAMVFGLGLLLVILIFLSTVFTPFQQRLSEAGRWPAYLGDIAISGIVELALFAAMFKFLPQARTRWKNVWQGALIAAILFTTGRFGLATYFKHTRISTIYGAAGSVVVVLIWIYFSSFSVFFGAEFTKVCTKRYSGSHGSSRHHAGG
jgi:membrane protein